MHGIFDTRPGTRYNDIIESQYHFPNQYLPVARQCLGDWIIYREPRRGGGRSGYIAVARLVAIEPDLNNENSSYATMGDFLTFDTIVPLDGPTGPYESVLNIVERSRRGITLQGKSLRTITTAEFVSILAAGLPDSKILDVGAPAMVCQQDANSASEMPQGLQRDREVEQRLINRIIRDTAFRRKVIFAYDGRCAMTGMRFQDSRGNFEAQAAHIWPVADDGPDIVQNGVALCATVHWLFDRHLISLTDNFEILGHERVPHEVRQLLLPPGERIKLPQNQVNHPYLEFVRRHRQRFDPDA